jgi:glutathione synthase/RimK-type ligase-like ATP-grasp enzyme
VPNNSTILERFPELGEHSVAPPALLPFDGIDEAERALTALCAGGATADVLAMLGNLLVRRGRYVDALEAYRSAADRDPSVARTHWACAEIAHVLDDSATSREYRARALALDRVYPDPMPVGARTPVLLLLRDAPYSVNTPLELLLDRSRVAIHKYYLEGDEDHALPSFAVAFTGFGSAHSADAAMRRAGAFAHAPVPLVNDPARIGRTAREALDTTLLGIDGIASAQAHVVSREEAAAAPLPALIRPLDTHAGDGFALLETRADVQAHLARFPAERYYVSTFVDYRSNDGLYRKLRVIFVDGVAYPYHLAVAPQWMVHYQTSPMREAPSLREEERAFLEDPLRVLPAWEQVMPQIAAAVGLDYFGIDATVLPDGRLFVFEADAAMLVHDENARDVLRYKRPYVARIREALHAAIARRTPQRIP